MRDSEIRIKQEISRRNERLLYRQFEFLETRNRAAESVLLEAAWHQRLAWLFFPKGIGPVPGIKDIVDAVQRALLVESDEQRRKALIAKPSAAQVEVVRG